MKRSMRFLFATILIVALLLTGSTVAVMAEDEDPAPDCIPFARMLAVLMDVDCEVLMGLHADGIGFGQIMKAWRVSQMVSEDGLDWEDLLQRHVQEDLGWGEVMMAYRLAASFDVDPEDLLALKVEDGLGWGQIKQAFALADADLDITVDEALALFAQGLEWGEIRQELGLPPGPPPWAGGFMRIGPLAPAEDTAEPGPPPWAGGPPQDGPPGQSGNGRSPGPPPWAGRPGGRP